MNKLLTAGMASMGAIAGLLFSGTVMATATQDISPYPLGERGVLTHRAIEARLQPVGSVCVQGNDCGGVQVAANDTGSSEPRSGKAIYEAHCSTCHASGVAGAPKFGTDDWAPHIAKGMDTLYHSAINGFKAMPPMGMCGDCSDQEIHNAVNYMVSNSGGEDAVKAATENADEGASADSEPDKADSDGQDEAASDDNDASEVASNDSGDDEGDSGRSGEAVYKAHCSTCHATGVAGAPKFGTDDWKPHIAKGMDTLYKHAMTGFKAMPPKGLCSDCTQQDLDNAVNYMVSHSGGEDAVKAASGS